MEFSPRVRVVLLVVLVGLLFGLTVWYGSLEPDPAVGAFVGADELGNDYEAQLGERVTVGGEVVSTDPVLIAPEIEGDRRIRLRLVGLADADSVAVGSNLNVYGIVEPEQTIRVLNAVRVERSGIWYTYSISFLAGLWVLSRIVRHWELDRSAGSLRRREPTVSVWQWVRSRVRGPVDDA